MRVDTIESRPQPPDAEICGCPTLRATILKAVLPELDETTVAGLNANEPFGLDRLLADLNLTTPAQRHAIRAQTVGRADYQRGHDDAKEALASQREMAMSEATAVTRKYGKDAARALLGHTSESTTEIYLDPDVQTAMRVAKEVG